MKFRPKCLSGKTQMAVDNRGRLLPCCYIDTPKWIEYEEIKKLADEISFKLMATNKHDDHQWLVDRLKKAQNR